MRGVRCVACACVCLVSPPPAVSSPSKECLNGTCQLPCLVSLLVQGLWRTWRDKKKKGKKKPPFWFTSSPHCNAGPLRLLANEKAFPSRDPPFQRAMRRARALLGLKAFN